MLPQSLKGFSVSVDGRGYFGRLDDGQMPKISIKTVDHRDGGMDGAVELDMGVDKMMAAYSFAEFDPELLVLWGLLDGSTKSIVLTGSFEGEDGTGSQHVSEVRGFVKEMDPGTWKPGEKASLKLTHSVRYFRHSVDGRLVYELDPENCIRVIDGVDQLAARRQRLGL